MDCAAPSVSASAGCRGGERLRSHTRKPYAARHRVTWLSLSRLNHWLPRSQADPEVMQGTADFHYDITDALLPQAALTTRQRLQGNRVKHMFSQFRMIILPRKCRHV